MRAVAIVPGKSGAALIERPEPGIADEHHVKLRVLRVGICGTDREQIEGGRALVPQGQHDLVIGHEMLGQVIETGKTVTRAKPGDYALFTVRRGCGHCLPCAMGRSDMCLTGDYRERGIWGLDGYQAEYVVDQEQYLVQVPETVAPIGVLTEPLSIVEKAIDEALRIQFARLPAAHARPHWLFERRCLVAGLGPVGLLAAMALRLRGAEVWGLDIVDPESARPRWLAAVGGRYLDGRRVSARCVDDLEGPMDLVFEAAGVPTLSFNLLDALAPNGIYVVTGIPGGDRMIKVPGADLLRQCVLNNLAVIGSVNACRDHFQMAVDDLLDAGFRWSGLVERLITDRFPPDRLETALGHHSMDEIKAVIEWS